MENKTGEDFISLYLQYTNQTECPTFFHRWTAVATLSAFLGRSVHFNHGHFTIHANIYAMLIGSPGTKKSSAIKIGAKLAKQAGYTTFAAKKTRQEKFLLDMAEQSERKAVKEAGGDAGSGAGFDILDQNLFGDESYEEDDPEAYVNKPPAEVFVAADEFNNFIGIGNLDFISILGELWDYEGVYDYKLKNSKSVFIPNPFVTILGGNTPTGFAQAFPTDSIGQGFFSRLLLIYGEPTGVRYTFPPVPDAVIQQELIDMLYRIKANINGEMRMTQGAVDLLDKIYHNWEDIDDVRFEHYSNRRLTHLLKLAMVVAASKFTTTISQDVVVEANTLLTFTEHLMPKALGEFGKAANSDNVHKVMNIIYKATEPVTLKEVWKLTYQDFNNRNQLMEILNNLQVAEKIQAVDSGFLPIRKIRGEGIEGAVDYNLLTKEERDML